jgi:hypothetical protein
MHVHKEKIKELAGINDAADKNRAVDAYSFLVYVKSKIPSSIIYGYFSKMNRSFLVKRLGLDYRTIEKGFKLLIEHELTKRSGYNLRLKSLEKDFDYSLKENGKRNKNWKRNFIRFKVKEGYKLSDCRDVIRGLMIKVSVIKNYYAAIFVNKDSISNRELNKRIKLIYDFRSARRVKSENLYTKIGIRRIAKIIGASTSTADRVISKLIGKNIVYKKKGRTTSKGRINDLIIPVTKVRAAKFGCFPFNGMVLQREVNSYVF